MMSFRTFFHRVGLAGALVASLPAAEQPLGYRSRFFAMELEPTSPAFRVFATDSLGRGERLDNVVLTERLDVAAGTWRQVSTESFAYLHPREGGEPVPGWEVSVSERQLVLRSRHHAERTVPAFVLLIDQKKNHATLLAQPAAGWLRMALPAVLHLPDRGTFRVTTSTPGAQLEYDARRGEVGSFVRIAFPAATAAQPDIEYKLESVQIYPRWAGVDADPRYDGFRRNFLNLIQFHPRLGTLANNSSSDVCGFVLWQYAELARHAPPLADGLTVMDLLRVSLDRVLDGGLTYGQAGYRATPEYPDAAPWAPEFDSLDTLPSLLIAGAHYVLGTGDRVWTAARFERLVSMGREMLAQDRNGNGLIEYRLSGNSGGWTGRERPANWWDTIGFGHEDAFSNALAFRACELLSAAAAQVNRADVADEFARAAQKIRAAYYPTFINPDTGLLAGWKSADGQLHDYAFTFIPGLAISFGLVDDVAANAIMDRLLAKMQAVGFTRFDLGLPGNLVPIRRADYTDLRRQFGGPTQEDGADAFQIYENGAATHCHAYWTVKALYRLGRVADARRIYHPMLQSFAAGEFQGFGPNGLSKDWRTWTGECNGYEGFLSDGFLALLAVEDDLKAGTLRANP